MLLSYLSHVELMTIIYGLSAVFGILLIITILYEVKYRKALKKSRK